MHPFIITLIYLGLVLFAYLVGSINYAIIVSRLWFKQDIRTFGSGNAGGTNMGRVFGMKAGMVVMSLDILKPIIVYWTITPLVTFTRLHEFMDLSQLLLFALTVVALGHCFPIYYKFKGGKAVSILGGYLLAVSWILALIGITIYILLLKFNKIVSLTSITIGLVVPLLTLLLLLPRFYDFATYPLVSQTPFSIFISILAVGILVILKHRTNIEKLQKGAETKIKWMK